MKNTKSFFIVKINMDWLNTNNQLKMEIYTIFFSNNEFHPTKLSRVFRSISTLHCGHFPLHDAIPGNAKVAFGK